MQQEDIDRVQEFRKCTRAHDKRDAFAGPRFLVRVASLEMHPLDVASRTAYLREQAGIGFCNITKCCTEVCPEHIKITDNAIIPLKERVADRYYDPLQFIWRLLRGDSDEPNVRVQLPVLPHSPDDGEVASSQAGVAESSEPRSGTSA